MTHKLEIVNLIFLKQAITAGTASWDLYEPELLIKADGIHADAGELCGFPDVNRLCHAFKDKPWSYVQSQEQTQRRICAYR